MSWHDAEHLSLGEWVDFWDREQQCWRDGIQVHIDRPRNALGIAVRFTGEIHYARITDTRPAKSPTPHRRARLGKPWSYTCRPSNSSIIPNEMIREYVRRQGGIDTIVELYQGCPVLTFDPDNKLGGGFSLGYRKLKLVTLAIDEVLAFLASRERVWDESLKAPDLVDHDAAYPVGDHTGRGASPPGDAVDVRDA